MRPEVRRAIDNDECMTALDELLCDMKTFNGTCSRIVSAADHLKIENIPAQVSRQIDLGPIQTLLNLITFGSLYKTVSG